MICQTSKRYGIFNHRKELEIYNSKVKTFISENQDYFNAMDILKPIEGSHFMKWDPEKNRSKVQWTFEEDFISRVDRSLAADLMKMGVSSF